MRHVTSGLARAFVGAISLAACSGGSNGGGGNHPNDAGNAPTSDGSQPPTTGPDGSLASDDASPSSLDAGPIALDAATPTATCTPPIAAVDTSTPTTVVGTGAGTCTEALFSAAIAKGGIIAFNCGGPATIPITSEKELVTSGATVIDGGGQVTLDGGGTTRILHFNGGNYRTTTTTVTLQNLTLAHAKASGTPIPTAPAPCSQGYQIDGGGGAILINDGELHVINCTFVENAAASPGPDVAGGAIYATGSLGVKIVGSTFLGNTASNGGAVGCLNSDLALANDTFSQNSATGSGANTVSSACDAGGGEVGNGGNGGAISIDGGSDGALAVCGATFEHNVSGALGGAMFRTPDGATQASSFDRSSFDSNQATQGGGAFYFHNSDLEITASTFSNNTAPGAGAIQADGTTLTLTNDTFAGNQATKGLGGAISLFSNGGTITNCTFANDQSSGGNGYFAAAIAGGSTFTIANTLFANNTTQDQYSPMQCQVSATGSGDLQWPKDHVVGTGADTACVTGITFADPELGALADNGGPTLTTLPGASGPAAGAGTACPPTDQRGQTRKSTGCTAGAVELP
jgi:predicted outer membrane repeat protein